jgi:hypothetical protein
MPKPWVRTDTSKGREIHGIGIEIESNVLSLLCPKGLPNEVKQQLTDVATDVLSLPGKGGGIIGVADNMMQVVDDALLFAKVGRAVTAMQRDSQWRSANRNQLAYITTKESIGEKLQELRDIYEDTSTNFKGRCRAILDHWQWDQESIDNWIVSGYLPRFIERTLDFYMRLLQKAEAMAVGQPWERVAHFLEFHAKKLATIRNNAPSRVLLLASNYAYLRDASADRFEPMQYQSELIKKLMAQVDKACPEPSKRKMRCTKCGTTLHTGGYRTCPLQDVSFASAKKLGKEAARLMEGDSSLDFEDAVSQARATKNT